MSRKCARESAFRLLYGFCVSEKLDPYFRAAFKSAKEMDADDGTYFDRLVDGVAERYASLSAAVGDAAQGYALDRIYKVDLALLLLAAYELKFCPEVSAPVVINEAVDLAVKYSAEKSGLFVNGVLAKLAAALRP
ncbi:MAG: transcription antitermination factor NusB [Clostridiales bacterium]|jgi:N utilization substance protein B|nr:transcription antitermination factor NusB [Clostridiales bacterium]